MITFRALDIQKDWPTVKWHVDCVLCEDTRAIAAERDGRLVAAFILDSWTENSVQCHQMVLDPFVFKHGFHKETAEYVFTQADRKYMIGLTPSDKPKAIKLNKHYGFKEVYRLPDGVKDGVDYVVMTMHRDECPYWSGNNGAIQSAAA